MATWTVHELERFRPGLLSHARQLHTSLGISPRPELAPERLVEGALAQVLRPQTTCERDGEEALGAWLARLLEEHVKSAWNDAVAEYLGMLSGYARVRWRAWGLPARRLDPADLVGEAWAKAMKHRGSFRGGSEGEYVVWLQRILENHARDQIDREFSQGRDVRREVEAAVEQTSARLEKFLLDPKASTPSKPLRREELAARIYAEIDRLPSPQREAVVLTLQGMTRAQVAAELAPAPAGNVSKLILLGLQTLRDRLKDVEGGL
jgi:RNA polymerase sigma-70 factor (ECF subfamily)